MDMAQIMGMFEQSGILKYVAAFAVLVLGYIAAKVISGIFRKLMKKMTFLEKFFRIADVHFSVDKVINILSIVVFYLILFVVVIAFLDLLGLESIKSSLEGLRAQYLPGLVGGFLVLVLAWVIATLVKLGIVHGAQAVKLDEKVSQEVSDSGSKENIAISHTLANAAYWFVFLFFLPSILEKFGLEEILAPIYEINADIVGYFPKLLAAAITFIVGLFIAKILKKIVTNLLSGLGADKFGKKVGLEGLGISQLAGSVVYVVVLFPVIIQALDALDIEAISGPAKSMLNTILNALPNLLFAAIIIGVSYVIGKLVSGIVTELLKNLGFNSILKKLGLTIDSKTKPAKVVGGLVFTFIMLFAAIEASNALGFEVLGDIVKQFVEFSGGVLTGVVILGIGAYIAGVVADLVKATTKSKMLPKIAKGAVLTLTIAMGLKEMGMADDIINLAFGLTLGSIAVAAALAFGLGSKDVAAKHLDSWLKNMK